MIKFRPCNRTSHSPGGAPNREVEAWKDWSQYAVCPPPLLVPRSVHQARTGGGLPRAELKTCRGLEKSRTPSELSEYSVRATTAEQQRFYASQVPSTKPIHS